jgi:hypothetical protein
MSTYRTMPEPCRECARREAEEKLAPKAPWNAPAWLLWTCAWAAASLAFIFLIVYLDSNERARRGELDEKCKPDGTCIAKLVCRTKDNGYTNLYCLPPREKATP